MKNLLLLLTASICLFTTSCSKQTEHSPPPTTVQHSTAKEVVNHNATIAEANGWVTAYNAAHVNDTANKTLFVDKELFAQVVANPDVAFVTMRLGLVDGHNTIVLIGWDSSGEHVVSVDQHFGIICMQCKCCDNVAINPDGTVPN